VFDVSLSELFLIGLIALVVIGPQRLPEVARAAGRWAGRMRRFVEDVKRDIDRETGDKDLAALRQIHQELSDTRGMLERSARDAMSAVSDIRQSVEGTPSATTASASESAQPAPALERPAARKAARPKVRRKTVTRKRHGKKRPTRR